jgi:lysozyme family protein
MTYSKALEFTLQWEGGLSNHPNDIGGLTNFGITQRTWESYRRSRPHLPISVRSLTKENVDRFYREMFWDSIPNAMNTKPRSKVAYFDTAVMSGIRGATQLLQIGVNTSPDGMYGPITNAAVSRADDLCLANLLCLSRERWRYANALANSSQRVFVAGWINRDRALRLLVTSNQF